MKNTFSKLKDALVLLRIPFSFFLMPVFLLGVAFVPTEVFKGNELLYFYAFLIIHLGLYPASNGYNSFHDKDEAPIGGLSKPPKVNSFLLWAVYLFDLATLIAAYFLGLTFFLWMLAYTLISKAYSSPKIRLKRYPLVSTAVVIFFQGPGIALAVFSLLPFSLSLYHYLALIGSAMFLIGSYPLTQIYQHKEDEARGDTTLSIKLGIQGTFQLANAAFGMGGILLLLSLFMLKGLLAVAIFGLGVLPVLLFFFYWWRKTSRNASFANHQYLTAMNWVSALCLSGVYLAIILLVD